MSDVKVVNNEQKMRTTMSNSMITATIMSAAGALMIAVSLSLAFFFDSGNYVNSFLIGLGLVWVGLLILNQQEDRR